MKRWAWTIAAGPTYSGRAQNEGKLYYIFLKPTAGGTPAVAPATAPAAAPAAAPAGGTLAAPKTEK